MNHETARSLFMDYLYDEITAHDRQQLEAYLQQHPDLHRELDALQSTRSLLQQMPVPEPERQLYMVEPRKRSFAEWWQDAKSLFPSSGLKKVGMAVAAGIILLLFLGSAAKLHFDFSDNGFSISMGYEPIVQQGLTSEEATELLSQLQEQNRALMAEYAASIREENQQQLQQVVRYVQRQRSQDLQLIEQNLDQLYQTNNNRWLQTNEFLGEFLQNVRYQDQN